MSLSPPPVGLLVWEPDWLVVLEQPIFFFFKGGAGIPTRNTYKIL